TRATPWVDGSHTRQAASGEMVGIWRAVTHRLDWSLPRQTTNVACLRATTGSSRVTLSTERSRLLAARMRSLRCAILQARCQAPRSSAGLAPAGRPAGRGATRGRLALPLQAGLERLHEVHHLAPARGRGRRR